MNMNIESLQASKISVAYRPHIKPSDRLKISSAQQAYQLVLKAWDKNLIEYSEQFKIILLNRANKVIGISSISEGGISSTIVDPKVIFAIALKTGASAIIMIHNHPSGNLNPSEADIKLTDRMVKAGKFLDINIYDHLIISNEGYYSFADEGLI